MASLSLIRSSSLSESEGLDSDELEEALLELLCCFTLGVLGIDWVAGFVSLILLKVLENLAGVGAGATGRLRELVTGGAGELAGDGG